MPGKIKRVRKPSTRSFVQKRGLTRVREEQPKLTVKKKTVTKPEGKSPAKIPLKIDFIKVDLPSRGVSVFAKSQTQAKILRDSEAIISGDGAPKKVKASRG